MTHKNENPSCVNSMGSLTNITEKGNDMAEPDYLDFLKQKIKMATFKGFQAEAGELEGAEPRNRESYCMNHPDRENTLALLTDWKKHHVAVEKLMDGAAAYIGIEPEGPMHDTVWSLFNAYTDTLAVEIGDYFEWLNWYCSETDMGKRSKAVEIHGKTRRIKTLAQLCTLIIQSRREIP